MAGIPDLATLLELVAVLLATGVIAGLLAGLLGVGGGIVIVPVLFQMFELLAVPDDIRMHLAVGTSLTTIVATSLISARAHDRRGSLDRAMLRRWWPGILLGTLAGTAVAGLVRGEVLSTIFAVVALLVALYMALTSPAVRLLDGLPEGAGRWLSGGLIGGFSAMMGIGGGTLAVPFMSACGVPVHRAVGTAAGIGVLIAVPATVGFVAAGWGEQALPHTSVGFVNLMGVLLITPASTRLAPVGARLAHRLSPLALRRAFALFLGLTAARMFYGLL